MRSRSATSSRAHPKRSSVFSPKMLVSLRSASPRHVYMGETSAYANMRASTRVVNQVSAPAAPCQAVQQHRMDFQSLCKAQKFARPQGYCSARPTPEVHFRWRRGTCQAWRRSYWAGGGEDATASVSLAHWSIKRDYISKDFTHLLLQMVVQVQPVLFAALMSTKA